MEQVSEAERIVKLMLLVRKRGSISFAAIREALPYEYGNHAGQPDATRRRFERDKKTLQDSGVFFDINEDQQYSLNEGLTTAAPLSLTKPQVSLLRLLCGALLQDKDYPLKEELRMVLVKLGDELEIPDMLPQFSLISSMAPGNDNIAQGFTKVKRAIASRKRLTFSYTSSSGNESLREVEPIGCFFLKGICYVVAYDPSANDERVFRLDRMSKIKASRGNSKSPDFEERPFLASNYHRLPFQFGEEDFVARVFFDESAASNAPSLAMGQGELALQDGGLLWVVNVRSSTALAKWCIENGPGITILEPHAALSCMVDGLNAYLSSMALGEDDEG